LVLADVRVTEICWFQFQLLLRLFSHVTMTWFMHECAMLEKAREKVGAGSLALL